MSSDSPINNNNNNNPWPDQDPSKNYALSGRIMLASVVSLFVIVFFLVILHLYARWYLVRLQFRNRRNRRRNRSTRIIFYVDNNNNINTTTTGGLDATVLKSLPVFVYSESDVDMPECAVCLSEFEPGETGRVLPKCKHGFHTGCIDMWFSSNSTCPLCRTPVEAVETQDTTSFQDNNSNINININNKMKQDDVGSSGDNRMKRVDVRIEVPNRAELTAGETELNMTSPSQGFRSPGGRLLSRIINMSRKSPAVSPGAGVGPSCVRVGTELDVESGTESSRPEGLR